MNASMQFRKTGYRHRLNRDADVRAIIRREGEEEPIEASLVDVSNNGIQLRVSVGLKFEESIAVQILATEKEFNVAGVVRWLRPADKKSWYVGCRLQPAFSKEALSQLASMGCIERRGSARMPIRLTATVCGELEHHQQAAVIHNLSAEGLGFVTPEPRTVGQQILVHVPALDGETIRFPARVQWQLQAPDGYLCGCSSTDREFYSRLCELIEVKSMASGLPDPPGLVETPRHSLWVALAVLIVFIFPTLLVVTMEANRSVAHTVQQKHSDHPTAVDHGTIAAVGADGVATAGEAPVDLPTEIPMVEPLAAPLNDQPAPVVAIAEPASKVENGPAGGGYDVVVDLDEEPAPADDPPSEYRTWVDNTGQYQVVARLIAIEGDSVLLSKKNGHTATVPLQRLSPEDNEYVRRWAAN